MGFSTPKEKSLISKAPCDLVVDAFSAPPTVPSSCDSVNSDPDVLPGDGFGSLFSSLIGFMLLSIDNLYNSGSKGDGIIVSSIVTTAGCFTLRFYELLRIERTPPFDFLTTHTYSPALLYRFFLYARNEAVAWANFAISFSLGNGASVRAWT